MSTPGWREWSGARSSHASRADLASAVGGSPPHGRRGERRRRAQALVEFAFTVPVLMVMFLGMIDFSRAFYGAVVAEQAAREGARLGMGASNNEQIPISDCTGVTAPCTALVTQIDQAMGLCTGCYNTIFLNASDVTINIGGYKADGTTYGRYQGFTGNPSNATCTGNCTGGSIQVEVKFNVPLLTGFLLSRLHISSIPVRGYATATLF